MLGVMLAEVELQVRYPLSVGRIERERRRP